MSLAIDTDQVTEVLLADGWHVVLGRSFETDSYEYVWDGEIVHGGGNSGVCATGFRFEEEVLAKRVLTVGPLTAVLAVRTSKERR